MMFMRVLEMESLCQAATGWILVLECLLSGTCGSQWLRLVLAGVKLPCRPMMPVSGSYAQDQRLPGDATVSGVCVCRGKRGTGTSSA
jgi:uncharacterized protein YjeT (DUF2065 family)